MKPYFLTKINNKILYNLSDLRQIFKFAHVKKNDFIGAFSIYLLREIKILYKLKVFQCKEELIHQMKVLIALEVPLNHRLINQQEYLYFVVDCIFSNLFGLFGWKDNHLENNETEPDVEKQSKVLNRNSLAVLMVESKVEFPPKV